MASRKVRIIFDTCVYEIRVREDQEAELRFAGFVGDDNQIVPFTGERWISVDEFPSDEAYMVERKLAGLVSHNPEDLPSPLWQLGITGTKMMTH